MEILEVIKYFAKFPDREGVLENFKRPVPSLPGYADFKTLIEGLPEPLMPEIKDFVVSTNETEVGNRIRNIDDYFLFVEYGPMIADAPDRIRLRNISFNLSAHVCYHSNKRNLDSMEQALIMDKCLELTFRIAKQMIADDNQICPHTRLVESSINFSPVEPMLMYDSIGWSLSFKKSNNIAL